ncbi:hypothetical protein CC78DRAFT_537058 [Lojkania enalia]|uniref:Uncharacterized protein n=1 Tax=Lojkania enalia TaxID=147567 RepID=A0A9P4JYU1_9PLEO|nr:hypothetical protein CC78DRAFT_537058 [Didymosphaeria enalia]
MDGWKAPKPIWSSSLKTGLGCFRQADKKKTEPGIAFVGIAPPKRTDGMDGRQAVQVELSLWAMLDTWRGWVDVVAIRPSGDYLQGCGWIEWRSPRGAVDHSYTTTTVCRVSRLYRATHWRKLLRRAKGGWCNVVRRGDSSERGSCHVSNSK